MPPAFAFPIGDWQFWVATVVFVAAVVWFFRGVLPVGRKRRQRGKKVTLTVEGRQAEKRDCERCGE